VLHQVGAGTLGPVFRAHDPAEGRLVAIKAFQLDLTPERAAEVAAGLQALTTRGLAHPSIADLIAAGVESSTPWLAQAYIPAESLDSALRQYGPPPVADALAIVTHLAGALDFAAAAGVVHGSLHPRDVLVAPDETHLIDIGVAGVLERHGLRATVRRPYSAPERVAGAPVSREADVFALAAIAWELLSGQPVAGAGDEAAAALPEIPGANQDALVETFAFALAVAPDERFQTALAFAAPLKRALGEALTLPPPPRRRRTTRPLEGLLPLAGSPPATDTADNVSPPPTVPPEAAAPPQGPTGAAGSEARSLRDEFALPGPDEQPVPVPSPRARRAPKLDAGEPLPVPPAAVPEVPAEPAVDDGGRSIEPDQRYAAIGDPASPLDVVDLNLPAHGAPQVWDEPDEPQAVAPPQVEPRRGAGVERPVRSDVSFQEGRASFREDRTESRRPSWLAIAAMLLLAALVGFAGGYLMRGSSAGSVDSEEPETAARLSTQAGSATEPGTADSSGTTEIALPPEPVPEPTEASPPPSPPEPAPSPAAAPPATAPAPRPAPPRGRIAVRTRPAGVSVTVDGRSRGVTPLSLTALPYGTYLVRMSRDGYVTDQRRVTLSASQPTRTIDVALRRSRPAAAPTPTKAAPPPPSTRPFEGALLVESRPAGARVYVDGRLVGTTPMSVASIRVGSHVVRLELDGYRRWSDAVRVVAGERTRVAASLEEENVR
jgi:serine/threonine protein kinase